MSLLKNEVTALGLMADAPPTVAMALCVGKFAVPKISATLVADDGNVDNVDLVDISHRGGGYKFYKWLWAPMGVNGSAWNRSCPWNLPLLMEIQASIFGYHFKRSRSGGFVDLEHRSRGS